MPGRSRHAETSRCLAARGMEGLRGARGRPRSCCSFKRAARLARPARGIFLEPHVAAYRQWPRRGAESRARLTRRPTRYSAGGRGRDPRGRSVSHGAVIRAYRELCFRDIPSVPRHPGRRIPAPRCQDGPRHRVPLRGRDGRKCTAGFGSGHKLALKQGRGRWRLRREGGHNFFIPPPRGEVRHASWRAGVGVRSNRKELASRLKPPHPSRSCSGATALCAT